MVVSGLVSKWFGCECGQFYWSTCCGVCAISKGEDGFIWVGFVSFSGVSIGKGCEADVGDGG